MRVVEAGGARLTILACGYGESHKVEGVVRGGELDIVGTCCVKIKCYRTSIVASEITVTEFL